jgi:hypothetical protein
MTDATRSAPEEIALIGLSAAWPTVTTACASWRFVPARILVPLRDVLWGEDARWRLDAPPPAETPTRATGPNGIVSEDLGDRRS